MLSQEMNDRLTRVEAGTPMGELLRRYWHIVAIASELDEDPVRPVRLLGEDLVLFRTELGETGLIGKRCAHRGISLAYGVPQTNGLRCAYHGWTYDVEGRVVDMPFEPACLPLRAVSYPVQELGGLIFAYLGPQPIPLLPRWDLYVRDDLDKTIFVTELPCNWLQCMDNSLDPVHFEHLHAAYGNYAFQRMGLPPAMTVARHVKIDFDVFEYGIYKRRLLEGEPEDCDDWQIGHPVLFPNILAVGDSIEPSFQVRIPIDDTHTMHYRYLGQPPKGEAGRLPVPRVVPVRLIEDDGSIVANTVLKQDMLAWVGQGPISDRTREHLATSDRGVALYHQMLLDNVERVQRGGDPMGVIRDDAINTPSIAIKRETTPRTAFAIAAGVI